MSTNTFRSLTVRAASDQNCPAAAQQQATVRRFRFRAAGAMALAVAGLALAPLASAFADEGGRPDSPNVGITNTPHPQYPAPVGRTPHGTYQNPHKTGRQAGGCAGAHFMHVYTELGELLGVEPRLGTVVGAMPTFP